MDLQVVLTITGILCGFFQACIFYFLTNLNSRFKDAKTALSNEVLRNTEERNKISSDLTHKTELLELRIRTLETHSITKSETKELIDEAVKPLRESMDDLKVNVKGVESAVFKMSNEISKLLGTIEAERKNK